MYLIEDVRYAFNFRFQNIVFFLVAKPCGIYTYANEVAIPVEAVEYAGIL